MISFITSGLDIKQEVNNSTIVHTQLPKSNDFFSFMCPVRLNQQVKPTLIQ